MSVLTLPWVAAAGSLGLFNYPELDGGRFADHQASGIQWLYDHPRSMLSDDVGLGKTVQAAGLLAMLHERGEMGRALVVVPASLISQWRRELNRWVPSLVVHDATEKVIRAPSAKQRAAYETEFPNGPDVLLVGYDYLNKRIADMEQNGFTTVVFDEANQVDGGGSRHESLSRVTYRASRVHGLTASPFENDATETYEILATIGTPGLWSRQEFHHRFVLWSEGYRDYWGQWVERKPIGLVAKELPALRDYLGDVYLRRTVEEVGLKLPTLVGDDVVWLPLSAEQRQAMVRADRMNPGRAREAARERAVNDVDGKSPKADEALRRILQRPHDKVVVWMYNLNHLSVMSDLLDQYGIGWVRLDGKMKPDDRTEALRSFREDEDCRVLIGNNVLVSGLNLQHARVIIALGAGHNPARERQLAGRVCRIGSPHSTYEYTTILSDCPYEKKKLGTRSRKSADNDAVFGAEARAAS